MALILGLVISMFTAIFCARVLFDIADLYGDADCVRVCRLADLVTFAQARVEPR